MSVGSIIQDFDSYRVVVADSHEIVREGLANRLEDACDVNVVGEAGDGYTTIKVCRTENPDLLVMDLSLVRPSGLDTFRRLRETKPEMKIIVMSSEASPLEAFQTISLGAVSFLPKCAKSSHFVNAVNAAMLGYCCIPEVFMPEFLELRKNAARNGNIFGLSAREVEILIACANGLKSKEVAGQLDISVRTVETHRNSIYRKTNCRDLTKLLHMITNEEETTPRST